MVVVARNSSFTYRGKAVLISDVARDLGVRYVLEGSVRRAGNRIRVNAQIIDAGVATELAKQRFCKAEQLYEWSLHADRIQIKPAELSVLD